jgi:hypothetical protein
MPVLHQARALSATGLERRSLGTRLHNEQSIMFLKHIQSIAKGAGAASASSLLSGWLA